MSIVAHSLFIKFPTARECGDLHLLSRLGLLLSLLVLTVIVGRAQVPGDAVAGASCGSRGGRSNATVSGSH